MTGGLFDEFATAPASEVFKEANVSDCGVYRYTLLRSWERGNNLLPVVMLNPSTADAALDDPTIRRCMAFAKRDYFGGIYVINLFAFRATDPEALKAAADPVGPENARWTEFVFRRSAELSVPILAAWGAHPFAADRAVAFVAEAGLREADLRCLGRTQGGAPRHPLYVKGDQPMEPFA